MPSSLVPTVHLCIGLSDCLAVLSACWPVAGWSLAELNSGRETRKMAAQQSPMQRCRWFGFVSLCDGREEPMGGM